MTAEPVAALHVLGPARVQQLTEAEHGDKHPRVVDLAGLEVKPLDRVSGVIDFYAFAGGELPNGDACLAVLRELTVKLLPKIRVGRQMLGPLLPQELQRVAEPEIVDERRPIDLKHPQRIGQRLGRIRRHPQAVSDLAYGVARTAERTGDLTQSPTFRQSPPDLFEPPHRHAAYPHIVNSFVWTHEGSRIGSGGRGYRQTVAATMAAVAPEEIKENLIADPWRPPGASKSAPQVVPN